NALYLLQTEEGISSDRLGLSLCFGAIESLLTTESKGPQEKGSTSELIEYSVALLQSNVEARKGAKTAIKSLYKRRSEMVHGRWVTPQPEDSRLRDMVRTLSVGVLIGVLQAKRHLMMT